MSEIRNTSKAESGFRPIILTPQPTGRRIITFVEGTSAIDMAKMITEATGTEVMTTADAGSLSAAMRLNSAADAPVVLDRFALAAVGGGQQRAANAAGMLADFDDVVDTRPEFWMFALGSPPWGDTAAATWGLNATDVVGTQATGEGIKLAILDTGIDLGHPDFTGRRIVVESFVSNETGDDVQGHGTHCAGTAASAFNGTGNTPRYGIAGQVELHIGKVLSNRGSGREVDIIAGIEWAIAHECAVISMSLGRPTTPEEPFDPSYERVARAALDAGSLIICAAGNESDRRFNYIAPVGSPANAPSMMAVAAIGADGGVASFSCGGAGTGAVDICGPGVSILSSVPRPQLYRKLNGTSMACPHVAGIAALWAASNPAFRGQALWDQLIAQAQPFPNLDAGDVGAGLAIAP